MKRLFVFTLILAIILPTQGQPQGLPLLSIDQLAIPESLGKIESKYQGSGHRWIIHIQDIHAHLTAQQNIQAILDHLHDAYGIETVGLEGTWLASSLPRSQALPSSREKQMLAQALLEEDYINGAVLTAISSQSPLQLVGIEDQDLYEQNGQAYVSYLKDREAVQEKISTLQNKIHTLKLNTYNPELLEFDTVLQEFREGKKAEKFLPYLLGKISQRGISLDDLAQIQTFRKALELEKGIDKEKLEAEAKRLKDAFKYERMNFEELLTSGKIPEEKLQHYPQAHRYGELLKIQETIQHRPFFLEIETAIVRAKEKLLETSEERAIDQRWEAFLLAKKIMTLQAAPSNLRAFETLKIHILSALQESLLDDALRQGLLFYALAKERDQIFFEKLTQDSRLAGNIAVVSGGFHTEGLSEKLEAARISHIVITPSLGKENEPMNEEIYFKRLLENLAPANQAFTDLPPQALTQERDQGFVRAAQQLAQDRNLRSAVAAYLSFQIGMPADSQKVSKRTKFTRQPESKRVLIVQEFIEAQQGKTKLVLILRQSVLRELLKDPVASALWHQEILANNANKIIVIKNPGEEIFTDTEGRAVVIQPKGDIETLAAQEKRKGFGAKALVGVIDPEFRSQDRGLLVLRAHPVSFLLVRPMLEGRDFRISFRDPESMNIAQAILTNFYISKVTSKAA